MPEPLVVTRWITAAQAPVLFNQVRGVQPEAPERLVYPSTGALWLKTNKMIAIFNSKGCYISIDLIYFSDNLVF